MTDNGKCVKKKFTIKIQTVAKIDLGDSFIIYLATPCKYYDGTVLITQRY